MQKVGHVSFGAWWSSRYFWRAFLLFTFSQRSLTLPLPVNELLTVAKLEQKTKNNGNTKR